MSKRRKPGDWVWLERNTGFVGESDRLKVEIQPEDHPMPCWMCSDPECSEWATLLTEPDPRAEGTRHMLCHVSECEMFDDTREEGIENDRM